VETMTIRVRPHTYSVLEEMAKERGESLSDALDHLVDELRRWRMLQKANEAYAAIAADPEADAAWKTEIAAWDVTLADGLEEYPDKPGDW
jgi:hypothetical protein